MSDQQTWVEALNINPDLLAEWSAQAPARKPILVHCIEQGLVDYGEYMRWAQERFQLPVLQANYFQATFDPSQLDQAKITGEWHPWIYPVDKWENITYIACVEPPQEPESPDVRYVLADPRAMRDAWGGTATTIRPLNSQEVPPPVPAEDLPNGLTASPPPFVLDLDNATFNIGPVTEVKPRPVAKVEEEAEEEIIDSSQVSEIRVIETPAPVAPPAAPKAQPKAPELKVVPSAPQPVAAKKAPAPQTAVSAADEDGAIKTLFTQLRERYSASLILKCDGQNARLYKNDQTLTPSKDSDKTSVNLSYPTFLRIVSKTNLPYHGYLVDSPAHQEFFTSLGLDKLPVCVTAIPVRFETFLWGIVVAFGDEENQKMESLSFAQEATEKLLTAVGAAWSKAS